MGDWGWEIGERRVGEGVFGRIGGVAQMRTVDVGTLDRWLTAGEAVLVDVRQAETFARCHIPAASCVPLATLSPAALPPLAGRRLVVQCEVGVASACAAERLLAAGLTEIWNLEGGIRAWAASGRPVSGAGGSRIDLPRQVQIAAGSLVVLGTVLGALVSPWFLVVSGGVGAGLLVAGATGSCAMARLLAILPVNRAAAAAPPRATAKS